MPRPSKFQCPSEYWSCTVPVHQNERYLKFTVQTVSYCSTERLFSRAFSVFTPSPCKKCWHDLWIPPTPSAHSFGLARHKKQGLRFVMQIYSFKQELPAHFASQWHICDARMTRLWPYFALHNVVKFFLQWKNVFKFFFHPLKLEILFIIHKEIYKMALREKISTPSDYSKIWISVPGYEALHITRIKW